MTINSFLKPSGTKILIVAEKNSVAKAIHNILKSSLATVEGHSKSKGKSKYNPIYKITLNSTKNRDIHHQIVTTSVSGFIYQLDFVKPFSKKSKWKLDGLDGMIDAEMEWIVSGTKSYRVTNKKIISQIKEIARKSDILVIATDNDFAGELIGTQILNIAMEINPRIQSHRMVFSSLSQTDIINAWQDLKDICIDHSNAELVRQKTDLMTGALFTRLLTLLVQKRVPGILISWGGCQTLFLKHIVDKYRNHVDFEPEQFWEVTAVITQNGKDYKGKWTEGRQFKRRDAKMCVIETKRHVEATISKVERSEWKKYPPVPLRTASLLSRLSKIMRTSPKQIMGVAEELYQKGFISYPRTENEVHPYTFVANRILDGFKSHSKYGGYVTNLLNAHNNKRIYPRKGRHHTAEHDPIHPTKSAEQSEIESAVKRKLRPMAWRVYDFIARHFIATCSSSAVFNKTEMEFTVGNKSFALKGKEKVSDGFLAIYPFYRPRINEVPTCKVGDVLPLSDISMTDGWTQPPPLSDDSEVIKWASDHDIGTDATFHSHLETVMNRKYVEKKDNDLVPTELGLNLCKTLEKNAPLMVDTELRKELQSLMDMVSEGKMPMEKVIEKFKGFAEESYDKLTSHSRAITDSLSEVLLKEHESGQDLGVCGKCGSSMHLETRHKYGNKVSRYAICERCDTELVLPRFGKISVFEETCPKCNFNVLKIKAYPVCPYCFTQHLEKGLFYCNRCKEKCKFSGGTISQAEVDSGSVTDLGSCVRCDGTLKAVITARKRFVRCSNNDCNFYVSLPRKSKGKLSVSDIVCPECRTKLFAYQKRYPKGKYGKETRFCVGCKDGKYNWCFSCETKCECK